jgi:hypothetical protein
MNDKEILEQIRLTLPEEFQPVSYEGISRAINEWMSSKHKRFERKLELMESAQVTGEWLFVLAWESSLPDHCSSCVINYRPKNTPGSTWTENYWNNLWITWDDLDEYMATHG